MDKVGISELSKYALYVRWKLEELFKSRNTTTDTVVRGDRTLRAGTVITCRPSKYASMAARIGENNFVLMDTSETEGFYRGAGRVAEKWTNAIYPKDIGPSCSGITSDTVSVPVGQKSFTPTTWDIRAMFSTTTSGSSSASGYLEAELGLFGVIPTTIATQMTSKTAEKVRDSYKTFFGPFVNPASGTAGGEFTPTGYAFTASKGIISGMNLNRVKITDKNTWWFPGFPKENFTNIGLGITYPGTGVFSSTLLNDMLPTINNLLLWNVVDPVSSPKEWCYIPSLPSIGTLVPDQLAGVRANSNFVYKAQQTPELIYGGYSRENPPGTGPDPIWGQTVLIQLKIIRDVSV